MKYYHLSIDIEGQKCVVVGGGKIALRKVRKLSSAGAKVTVIAPNILPEIQQYAFSLIQAKYYNSVLKGAVLVFASTSDAQINQQICNDAESLGIWANACNGAEYGSFIIPASCPKGILNIGITTEGKAPALSKAIRKFWQERMKNVSEQWIEDIVNIREQMVACKNEQEKSDLEVKMMSKVDDIIAQIKTDK